MFLSVGWADIRIMGNRLQEYMTKITKEQYEFAMERIEELLPVVDGYDTSDKRAVELSVLSDIIVEYEKEHYPIEKPTIAELIADGLVDKSMSQKELAASVGISPSRINSFVTGKSEPSLKQARLLCQILGIQPAAILGL